MPSWRDEYIASLRDSELQSPVNMELVQACSQMADRISALEAEKAALQTLAAGPPLAFPPSISMAAAAAAAPAAQADILNAGAGGSGGGIGGSSGGSSDPTTHILAQLRADLAEALRSKGTAETRLRAAEEDLARLHARTKLDAKSLRDLRAERAGLATKVNDREHELREKRKLVEQVQDEMITLNLQLSMAEKERDRVKRENKELVDRWMKRMEQEAEAMNLANEPRARRR